MDEPVGKSASTKKRLFLARFFIAFLLLLFILFLINAQEAKSGITLQLPRLKGYIVLSGSMSPTFGAGSYILVKEAQPEDIEVGDILTYAVDAGAVLTHRVVDRRIENGEYLFQTQGDANNTPDERLVTQDKIIGTALIWVNGLGSLLMLIRQPKSIAFIFSLAGLILLTRELMQTAKRKGYGHEGGGNIEKKQM